MESNEAHKEQEYNGLERREFPRLGHVTPLAFKICKEETVSKLLQGYTADVSQAGLLCTLKQRVNMDDILWLSFDRSTLDFCEDMEKKILIYQNGIIGKVVRINDKDESNFDVGVQFLTREEKNLTNIYPRIHFVLTQTGQTTEPDEDEEI